MYYNISKNNTGNIPKGGVNLEDIIGKNKKFVVLDIETSHFTPEKGGMIIELAAVKIVNGKIVDKRTQLINPERKITTKITEITGITNEMLIGKPTFREVLPNFYNFIKNSVIVAHNAKFDWDRFLLFFLKKIGIYPTNQVMDTLLLSRKYIKSENGYSLGAICKTLGIEHIHQHRALGDALATAELFLYLKNKYIENEESQISLYETTNAVKIKPQNVRKVAYWEKNVKGKLFKRLYVTLDRAVVFYDIPTKAWEVKAANEPIDFKNIQKEVFEYLEGNKSGNIPFSKVKSFKELFIA